MKIFAEVLNIVYALRDLVLYFDACYSPLNKKCVLQRILPTWLEFQLARIKSILFIPQSWFISSGVKV